MADYPTEYSEELCTTAGELRQHGLPLPGVIPNGAWVPDSAIDMQETWAAGTDGADVQTVSLTCAIPFRLNDYIYLVTEEGVVTKTKAPQ